MGNMTCSRREPSYVGSSLRLLYLYPVNTPYHTPACVAGKHDMGCPALRGVDCREAHRVQYAERTAYIAWLSTRAGNPTPPHIPLGMYLSVAFSTERHIPNGMQPIMIKLSFQDVINAIFPTNPRRCLWAELIHGFQPLNPINH